MIEHQSQQKAVKRVLTSTDAIVRQAARLRHSSFQFDFALIFPSREIHYQLVIMESRVLLEVLNHQDSSLSACLSAFLKTFSKPQQFRGAYVLLTLLQEGLLSASDRVAAIFILHEISKQEDNLFLQPLLEAVDRDPSEALLLQQLMANPALADLSVTELLKRKPAAVDFEQPKKQTQAPVRSIANVVGATGAQHLQLGILSPEFSRPVPVFAELWGEAKWVSAGPVSEILWSEDNLDSATSEYKRLYEQAILAELRTEKADQLLKALDSDPNLLLQLSIDPEKFPPLVQRNPTIASNILVKLHHHELFESLTEKLIFMDLSVQQMEVMHSLLINAELPKAILSVFLTNSVNTCKNIKERSLMARLARLLCVLITTLMKRRLLPMSEIPNDVIEFFKQFQAHKDITELLRKLDRSPQQ